MTNVAFLVFRTFFITIMTMGMMASLTEFRFRPRKLLCILVLYSAWSVFSSWILLWLGGEVLLLRLFFFTISIPAIILTYWAANDTPTQAVFNYITQILLSLLAASMIRMATERFGLSGVANILLMLVFYGAAIFLEWRFVRRPFRMLLKVMPDRWGALTLIPCVFCFYLIFLAAWPGSYMENRLQRVYGYVSLIPMAVVYIAAFHSLIGQYRMQMERQDAALLTVQISALKEKLQKIQEMEEDIRIQRHDLRHQLHTVTELISRGEEDTALEFLDAARQRLDVLQETRWCRPPVLDAVFSSYFDQAQKQGIRVEASISLPGTLPVDESELAIVLANALENAIHANAALPREQRQIRCKIVGTPSVMLELINPCAETVSFDDQGLPLARREGHGLGVQSISAFCKRHGAVCCFEQMAGQFRLQLVL